MIEQGSPDSIVSFNPKRNVNGSTKASRSRNPNPHCTRLGAGIGRQAWFRSKCPQGREGSSPSLGTSAISF